MPRLFGHVHDVALVGEENRQRADAVANLPLENEPELRRLEMKVPLVVRAGLLRFAAMMLATARSSAMKRRVGSVPAATALKSTYGLLRASYDPLPPMRTFTKSKPGNDTGFSSTGYIVVAPPMFTSSRSDGVSPMVS